MTPIEQAIEALEHCIRAHVNTLENGRDRILFLGGDCDDVPTMEAASPSIRQARAALSALRGVDQQPVAAIKWTLDGDKTCGYNNWVGETAFGRILITWKGWKEDQDAMVDEFPGEIPNIYGSPDEVRAGAEAEFNRRLALTTPPPAPVLLTEAEILAIMREWPVETNVWADHIDFARAIESEVLRRVGGGV